MHPAGLHGVAQYFLAPDLEVEGKRLDIVAKCAKLDNEYDMSSIFDFLLSLSQTYLDGHPLSDLQVLGSVDNFAYEAPTEPVTVKSETGLRNLSSIIDIGIKKYLFRVRKLFPPYKAENHPKNSRESETHSLSRQSPQQRRTLTTQSAFEALWRTLIADIWEDQHPAPVEAGFAFTDCLMSEISRLIMLKFHQGEKLDPDSGPRDEIHKEQSEILTILKFIAESERAAATKKISGEVAGEGEALEPQFFLPLIKNAWDIVGRHFNLGAMAIWQIRFQQVMRTRKLFTTDARLLGIGPVSLSLGDEVWILADADVPLILR